MFWPAGTSKYDGQCQSLHKDWSWSDRKFGCSPVCSLSLSLSVYCTNIVFTVYIVYVDNYMTVTYVYHILHSKLTEGRTFMMALLRYFSALNGCLIEYRLLRNTTSCC